MRDRTDTPDQGETVTNAGTSTCPICKRTWLVTPADDCMMPACGHYGHDASEANPNRPCEDCGIIHAFTCAGKPVPTRKVTMELREGEG